MKTKQYCSLMKSCWIEYKNAQTHHSLTHTFPSMNARETQQNTTYVFLHFIVAVFAPAIFVLEIKRNANCELSAPTVVREWKRHIVIFNYVRMWRKGAHQPLLYTRISQMLWRVCACVEIKNNLWTSAILHRNFCFSTFSFHTLFFLLLSFLLSFIFLWPQSCVHLFAIIRDSCSSTPIFPFIISIIIFEMLDASATRAQSHITILVFMLAEFSSSAQFLFLQKYLFVSHRCVVTATGTATRYLTISTILTTYQTASMPLCNRTDVVRIRLFAFRCWCGVDVDEDDDDDIHNCILWFLWPLFFGAFKICMPPLDWWMWREMWEKLRQKKYKTTSSFCGGWWNVLEIVCW